jgi:hypothetical protein
MKALVITEYAHPSKLQLTRDAPEPVPTPGSDELLIDVYSAGLNFFDVGPAPASLPSISESLTRPRICVDIASPRKVPDATATPIRARCRVRRRRRHRTTWVPPQTRRPRIWTLSRRVWGAGRRKCGTRTAAAGCPFV